jgi:hypothetical protein
MELKLSDYTRARTRTRFGSFSNETDNRNVCLIIIRIAPAGSSACGVGLDLAMDEAGFVVVSGVDTRCPKTIERGDAIVRVDGFDVRGMRASEVCSRSSPLTSLEFRPQPLNPHLKIPNPLSEHKRAFLCRVSVHQVNVASHQ